MASKSQKQALAEQIAKLTGKTPCFESPKRASVKRTNTLTREEMEEIAIDAEAAINDR